MIFNLCRELGVPNLICDTNRYPSGTVYLGLIRDKAYVAVPWKCPRIEVPLLSENFVETSELAQGHDPTTSEPADTT